MKGTFTLEDILKPHALEERIYRFRCVEAWSMVVPWVGFPLGDLIKRFKPTSKAQVRRARRRSWTRSRCPTSATAILDWPYVEGLRMDEAMHPLTLMVVGVYGKALPDQNGAPLRLDRAVEVRLQGREVDREDQLHREASRVPPGTSATPNEYGFYANVNPAGGSPALEPGEGAAHRLGSGVLPEARQDTLPVQRLRG